MMDAFRVFSTVIIVSGGKIELFCHVNKIINGVDFNLIIFTYHKKHDFLLSVI